VDPVTYAVALPALGLVLAMACVIPALKATAAHPLDALRDD
jgi:ABC-type antimicrobial peptide transport system permease subunit